MGLYLLCCILFGWRVVLGVFEFQLLFFLTPPIFLVFGIVFWLPFGVHLMPFTYIRSKERLFFLIFFSLFYRF